MSRLGSFFRKFFLLDSQHADLAPLADSREVAALLSLDQEAAVRDDNVHCARVSTWFSAPKLHWNLPNLGRTCWIPEKPTGRMPGRCFCHYFCMLPHLQIGFGSYRNIHCWGGQGTWRPTNMLMLQHYRVVLGGSWGLNCRGDATSRLCNSRRVSSVSSQKSFFIARLSERCIGELQIESSHLANASG